MIFPPSNTFNAARREGIDGIGFFVDDHDNDPVGLLRKFFWNNKMLRQFFTDFCGSDQI